MTKFSKKPVVHKLNAYTFLGRRAECAITSGGLNDTEDWSKVTCPKCLAVRIEKGGE